MSRDTTSFAVDLLRTVEIAKDGNCVYRAVSEGLDWLSGGKIKVEHRELRAKAITHLQKHKDAYSAQWDKESPAGVPMQSFDDYLAASAQNCAYGSPLEIEALARVFDVQIILIPCLADFAVMSFRTSQAKRILVLWYENKHVDLLLPKSDIKKYPEAVVNITKGPVSKLRAGGPCSTSSRASKAASGWTIGARSSDSLIKSATRSSASRIADIKHLDTSSVWSRAPSDATLQKLAPKISKGGAKSEHDKSSFSSKGLTSGSARGRGFGEKVVCSGRSNRLGEALPASSPPLPVPSASSRGKEHPRASCKRKLAKADSDCSQDLSGCNDMPQTKRIYRAAELKIEGDAFPVKCPLCPYKSSASSFRYVRQCLRGHYAKHHRGVALPAPQPRRKASYEDLVRVHTGNVQIHWKCPLCPMAVLKEDAEKMCESSVAKHKTHHKRKHHPKIRWATWRKLDYEARAAKVVRTRLYARTTNSLSEISEMQDKGFNFLWWPRARGFCKNIKQQSPYIARMKPTWVCKQCGNTFLAKKDAIAHAKRICPFLHPQSAMSVKWCRRLLQHRIRVLAKLRDKFCASAPESDRKRCDLVLFDKALEHFGSFHF